MPSCTRSTGRPVMSFGRAAIRLRRGITTAGSRWPMAGSTSGPTMVSFTALGCH